VGVLPHGGELDRLRRPAVLLCHRRLTGTHVDQPELHPHGAAVPAHRADDHAVGVELFPAIERHLIERGRRRDRFIGVPADQVELALVVQIVPENLADRLRRGDRFRVVGQGDELGDGQLRRQARPSLDADDQFALGRRRPRRRRPRRRLLRGKRQRHRGAQRRCGDQRAVSMHHRL
jgi:hypothetical protein